MLPARLDHLLVSFAQRRTFGRDSVDVFGILAEIDRLHPAAMSWGADKEIAGRARLDRIPCAGRAHSPSTDRVLLAAVPEAAHLFIHHRDGRLREAALTQIDGPARSAFEVAAITYRLSDWVEPVRAAADARARRVFPLTDIDALQRIPRGQIRLRDPRVLLFLIQAFGWLEEAMDDQTSVDGCARATAGCC